MIQTTYFPLRQSTSLAALPPTPRLDCPSNCYRVRACKEHDGLRYAAKTIIFKLKDSKAWFFHDITSLERLATLPDGLVKP